MKKKVALVFGLGLIVLLSVGTGMVIGQTSDELPRVITACENKAGLIHGFDDGFSILKKCTKGSRQVVLGEKTTSNDSSVLGNVVFIDEGYVLLNDGTVWNYDLEGEENKWNKIDDLTITEVDVGDILDWNYSSFAMKSGDVYLRYRNSWTKVDVSTLGK